jgi:hypothetical protein
MTKATLVATWLSGLAYEVALRISRPHNGHDTITLLRKKMRDNKTV